MIMNIIISYLGITMTACRVSENIAVIPNIKHVFFVKLGSSPEPGPAIYLNLSASLRF